MTLNLTAPELAPLIEPLSAYGRRLVALSGAEALRLFADEVDPEHLLLVVLADEESAAHRACLHAFADPDTIYQETLALTSGILVVGSAASLPFSPNAVRALHAARARAAAAGALELDGDHLLVAAVAALPPETEAALRAAGYNEAARAVAAASEALSGGGVREDGPLFRDTSAEARRVLSSAARLAQGENLDAISPAHVVLAALDADRERAARSGLSAARARMALQGRTADHDRPVARVLPASLAYRNYLGRLPAGAGSLAILLGLVEARARAAGAAETPEIEEVEGLEVAQLLERHRITRTLLERARDAFEDPL